MNITGKIRQPYQPKTGARCSCKPGVVRDNCPACEGTGWVIDFAAIRASDTASREGGLTIVRYTIIQSSELTAWNRMDPRFFIALRSVEARYRELKETMPLEEVRRRLGLLTTEEKAACLVLARGSGAPKIEAVEREYPHLAWALIESTLEALEAQEVDALARLRARLNDIRQWRIPSHVI